MPAAVPPTVDNEAAGKAEQLERDFGVRHPAKALHAALRQRDDRDIEPFQTTTCAERLADIVGRGWDTIEAAIIILMRGGKLDVLGKALSIEVEALVRTIRSYERASGLTHLYGEASRGLDLWRRA